MIFLSQFGRWYLLTQYNWGIFVNSGRMAHTHTLQIKIIELKKMWPPPLSTPVSHPLLYRGILYPPSPFWQQENIGYPPTTLHIQWVFRCFSFTSLISSYCLAYQPNMFLDGKFVCKNKRNKKSSINVHLNFSHLLTELTWELKTIYYITIIKS